MSVRPFSAALSSADVQAYRRRFNAKVHRGAPDACWCWTAYQMDRGDGMMRVGRRMVLAHRIAYALDRGDIPEGMTIDHQCGHPWCVNPRHLELATVAQNVGRAVRRSLNAEKTECPKGHPYDEVNTYVYVKRDGRKQRQCRTCMSRANR